MTTITITPNFTKLVHQFLADSRIHAQRLEGSGPETVSAFRNFLVSLNIAAQAVHNEETVLLLRQELHAITMRLVARDDANQAQAWEAELEADSIL